MAEEAVIACAHPVISILKLRPKDSFKSTVYYRIKEHTVLFSQNPSSVLTLLLSLKLAVYNLIYVVWYREK